MSDEMIDEIAIIGMKARSRRVLADAEGGFPHIITLAGNKEDIDRTFAALPVLRFQLPEHNRNID